MPSTSVLSGSVPQAPVDTMEISIKNTGVELAPDELPRIFEKFYRIRQHDVWKRGGTGLGLALVKKLLDRVGGEIHVESFDHQVIFKIHLPLRPVPNPIANPIARSVSNSIA